MTTRSGKESNEKKELKAFRALERPLRRELQADEGGNHLLHGVPVHHMNHLLSLDPRKYVDHAGAYRKGSPRTNGVDTRLEHKIFQAEKNGLDEMPRVRAFKHPDEKAYRHPEKQAGVKVTAMKYHMHTATYDGKPLVQHSPARRLLENTYNAVVWRMTALSTLRRARHPAQWTWHRLSRTSETWRATSSREVGLRGGSSASRPMRVGATAQGSGSGSSGTGCGRLVPGGGRAPKGGGYY